MTPSEIMEASDPVRADGPRPAERAGYRRSAGTERGEARRHDLLNRVTDDLAANGLVNFSLRRAARVAGTTHKVLLYYFDGPEDLLAQAIHQLRDRRIGNALAAVALVGDRASLSERVCAIWPVLLREEARILDQAIGLTMYDPLRYAELGRGASQQYLPTLLSICPDHWPDPRKLEVAAMVLGALRGFLIERRTGGNEDEIQAGFTALTRALEREEASPD